ncbi:MAG: hypothetical protein ABS36_04660 [Acidobacteria bacterium SCN 69-37]|mgnify:CR=1 FL=1|nr:MAG: hypothetical protein ABS36_04660 [Acidobacteria bacterium SCN 69-37]
MDYSVVIAGGGPAGALAARKLTAAGARVLVVDRARPGRIEAAEILSPEGQAILDDEKIWPRIPLDFTWPCTAVAAAWDRPEPDWTRFDPCAWHVDRIRFDAWMLVQLRSAGVDVVCGTAMDAHRIHDGWRIAIVADTVTRTVSASCLILATGRTSRTIRLARRDPIDTLCLVAGTTSPDPVDPDALIVEAAPDGWWYSAPLVSGRLFAGWMTDFSLVPDGDYARAAAASLPGAPLHTRRLGAPQLSTIIGSASWRMTPAAGDGWVAIGDAALARDPIGGDGLTAALRSARHGADVVTRALDGDRTAWADAAAHTDAIAERYVHQRLALYRRARTRWPTSTFWQRFGASA